MRRFDLGPGPTEDDYVVDCDGQKLVIDSVSHEFVKGATVDFADELIKSTFEVRALVPFKSSSSAFLLAADMFCNSTGYQLGKTCALWT